ncbi:MAG: hypothetical protein RIS70_912 [Planctomycetota bacterium]
MIVVNLGSACRVRFSCLLVGCLIRLLTLSPIQAQFESNLREWTVAGEKRQAIVLLPKKELTTGHPLLFVFHGHGGNMRNMARKNFQELWPEAVVVCPQGLATATDRDPEGKKSGWQPTSGSNDDRDLKLVDAILKDLQDKHKIDRSKVFATGHSNGGGFTYLLWQKRADKFAAFAPIAAGARASGERPRPEPRPILHIAGEKDLVVPFEGQQRMMKLVKTLNHCKSEGKPWAKAGSLTGTIFDSTDNAPFVEVTHPGGHPFPDKAPELIVRFFKEIASPANAPSSESKNGASDSKK